MKIKIVVNNQNYKPCKKQMFTKTENWRGYKSEYLFPFFFNMLSEGVIRQLQTRQLKIGEKGYFRLLLATAKTDAIGAITLSEIKE